MAYLKMMGEVYDVFGLDYKMALSTRPEGYLGELEVGAALSCSACREEAGACKYQGDQGMEACTVRANYTLPGR